MTTDNQAKKQGNYDFIKGYQWVKGQSGNPKGRPKGKTLKEFAKDFLKSLPDEEKIAYLKTLPSEIVWKMAEGNPDTKNENTIQGTVNVNLDYKIAEKYGINPEPENNSGGQAPL